MVDINKNPPWFRTASQCQYSGLPISHPVLHISQHPGSNYFVDVAKLGDEIVLVKASGNVRFYEMKEALRFIDDYVPKKFDVKTGVFLIEDYGDVGSVDSIARKLYIDHHKKKDYFWGGIFYNMPRLMQFSFKISQRLHIGEKNAYAVDSYKEAVLLALDIIAQRKLGRIPENKDFADFGGMPAERTKTSKSIFVKTTEKVKGFGSRLTRRWGEKHSRQFSERLLTFIESIDWQKEGVSIPETADTDEKKKKVFEAISYIKSEIDDLLEKRDASEKVLRKSEERYRQLVQHAKAGILEYDFLANRIISANDSFFEYTGYSKDEINSMSPLDLMTAESKKKFYSELDSHLLYGKPLQSGIAYDFMAKNGQKKWALLNSNITYKDGRPYKSDTVLIDITHLKEVEDQLIHYQSRLKQLSIQLSKTEETQRRQLASQLHESVSQELFVAQLKINALEKTIEDPEHSRQLDVIKDQIVKSIKEIKGITYHLSPPVLYDLGLKEAVESLSKSIEAEFHLSVKPRFNGTLEYIDDEVKIIIFRIIKELIHNSIKHASAGFINIIIESTMDNLNIDVSDNGIGFEAGNLSEGHYTGEGFGLFDIREKINHLGGRVMINSVPGSGTRIRLNVPLNEPALPALKN